MKYNIEFQIASIIFLTILLVAFYIKKPWPSVTNKIFRLLISLSFINLALDIPSVITITMLVQGDTSVSLLCDILAKTYLVVMAAYIVVMDIYAIVNTMANRKISQSIKSLKYAEIIFWILVFLIVAISIVIVPIYYGANGRKVFAQGPASNCVYYLSTCSVIFILIIFFLYCRKVALKRMIPLVLFCVMEGIVALIQMANPGTLITNLGLSTCGLCMYLFLENPDTNGIEELTNTNIHLRKIILSFFPKSIANRLETKETPFYDQITNVTIMFVNIDNFSKYCSEFGEVKMIKFLNTFFTELDNLLVNFKIVKIKSVNSSYLLAGGIYDNFANNCLEMIKFARQVLRVFNELNIKNNTNFKLKIGINNGRVITGVLGTRKLSYDVWGETVTFASQLANDGEANCINVSERIKLLLGDKFEYTAVEKIESKEIGKVKTYILE